MVSFIKGFLSIFENNRVIFVFILLNVILIKYLNLHSSCIPTKNLFNHNIFQHIVELDLLIFYFSILYSWVILVNSFQLCFSLLCFCFIVILALSNELQTFPIFIYFFSRIIFSQELLGIKLFFKFLVSKKIFYGEDLSLPFLGKHFLPVLTRAMSFQSKTQSPQCDNPWQ